MAGEDARSCNITFPLRMWSSTPPRNLSMAACVVAAAVSVHASSNCSRKIRGQSLLVAESGQQILDHRASTSKSF